MACILTPRYIVQSLEPVRVFLAGRAGPVPAGPVTFPGWYTRRLMVGNHYLLLLKPRILIAIPEDNWDSEYLVRTPFSPSTDH